MSNTTNVFANKPEDFFCDEDIIVHDITMRPGLSALNVGYEESTWRYDEFSDYLLDWLPEFALKYSDILKMSHANSRSFLKRAAKTVYQTDKYKNRGEFGELILHAFVRKLFNSQPAISKIYYKTSANETVKGFDAVHIVETDDNIELWLGEAKFYTDITKAIKDVVSELHEHCKRDYLKDEFILVSGKIDDNWSYADKVKKMLSSRTTLDTLFPKICFPVLLTYESKTIGENKKITAEFKKRLKEEVLGNYNAFKDKFSAEKIKVHLILLPLDCKQNLIDCLNAKLEGLQK